MATSITNTSISTDSITAPTVNTNTIDPTQGYLSIAQQNAAGEGGEIHLAGSNGNANAVIDNFGGSIRVIQGANTRLNINTNGYVITPYQPVSQIACTNAGLTTSGNRYEGTANVNIGSGWSNGSNQYTAPVTGTYLVNFSGWTNYTASYGYMGIYKNGANYYTWHYNHGNYQMHTFASGMLYAPLAQNDTIYFVRAGGGSGTYQGMYFNISLFG